MTTETESRPSKTQVGPTWARVPWRQVAEQYSVPLALVALLLCFSILMPGIFFTGANLSTIMSTQAIMLMLALAVTVPLRTHNFDLSAASTMVLTSAIAATGAVNGWGVWNSLLAGLGAALLVGCLNGVLVIWLEVDSFIATLAVGSVLTGITYGLTNTTVISIGSNELTRLFDAQLLGLPLAVWLSWILAVTLWVVFEFTPYGRLLLFVGGNREAARLAGVPVRGLAFSTYVVVGALAGVAGAALLGTWAAVDPSVAPSFLLLPYAAAFLGAATIQVGRFNALGTVAALYLLAVGGNGLQLMGADPWAAQVFNGATLLGAVVFAQLVRKRFAGGSQP